MYLTILVIDRFLRSGFFTSHLRLEAERPYVTIKAIAMHYFLISNITRSGGATR